MKYAYVFVLVDNRVCIFKHTGQEIISANPQKACFEDIPENFWALFEARYNIAPDGLKDYAFAWLNKVAKHAIVLNSPDFKACLQTSVWDYKSMRVVLDLLAIDCHLACSLEDFAGQRLEDGDLWLQTNVSLRGARGTNMPRGARDQRLILLPAIPPRTPQALL